jgi:hypothetical protein
LAYITVVSSFLERRMLTNMRLFFFALLALTSVGLSNGSNLTFFGAPRASLDPVLPVLSIEESYIRAQTDGTTNTVFGAADIPQCSASNPCADGSCCNLQGMHILQLE